MKKKLLLFSRSFSPRFHTYRRKVIHIIERRPLVSFLALLGLIVLLIVASSFLHTTPPATVVTPNLPKEVQVYRIGSAPKITIQAQTKKSGVIQIVALASGVVNRIYHFEGATVKKGTLLAGLSSNYQGGNALSLQRQLAGTQYQSILDTYPTQKELIQKQRDLANKTDENSDRQREITARSIEETRSLIAQNEVILNTLDQNITTLSQTPGNEDEILAARQLRSQYTASTNAARASLRNTEYETSGSNPPAQLADTQREIALKQLDIQEKQLNLNKEVSRLQFQIAQVNEGLMFPVAPFNGTVQRVLVKEKTAVTPGTPLMVFSQVVEEDPITAVAFVPREIAQRVSVLEPSILHIDGMEYATNPSFISTEAVEGTLYAIYYPIPDSLNASVVSEGFITVDIPVGYFDSSALVSFVPLDAVYQTRDKAYVFVIENGRAKSRELQLGTVFGRFVEVDKGLMNGDEIIVNRTVIDGDEVLTTTR